MENKQILELITPSWLSSLIGGTIAILGTAAAMAVSRFQGSELQRQIFENQANATTSTASSYDIITSNLANNTLINLLPLLLLWTAVGMVIYLFSLTIARSFGEAAELRDHLGYVHTSRESLIRQSLIQLMIRVAAIIWWFILLKLTISVFVPYALAAASLGARSISVTNIGFILIAVVILFVNTQLHAIVLRLIALKPRLFPG